MEFIHVFIIIITIILIILIAMNYNVDNISHKNHFSNINQSNYVDENSIDLSYLPNEFVVFDLETTGLCDQENEIIEIAAIKINSKSKDSDREFIQYLVKPQRKIPKKITKLTGITTKMINDDAIELEEAISTFIEFIGDCRLVAFNAPFDMGFIKKAAQKFGYKINNPVSCALKMAREAFPYLESYKLTNIAKATGMSVTGCHRALKDSMLTATIYCGAVTELKRNN